MEYFIGCDLLDAHPVNNINVILINIKNIIKFLNIIITYNTPH